MGITIKKILFYIFLVILAIRVGGMIVRSDSSVSDDVPEVDWRLLGELDVISGAPAPESLAKYHGQVVKVPGFMVPLEDNMKKVKQFLLVPSPQACIHAPAPPANQMVLVDMNKGREIEVEYGPIWIYGKLEIQDRKHMYGTSSFGMRGIKTELYR